MPRINSQLFTLNIPTYIAKEAELTISAELDLNLFGVRVINSVRRALEGHMASFMSNCKSGVVYAALCEEYGLRPAYYARCNGGGGSSLYINDVTYDMQCHLEAAQALSAPTKQQYANIYFHNGNASAWSCYVPREVVQKCISDNRPNVTERIALAVAHLNQRRPITFTEIHGGDDNA